MTSGDVDDLIKGVTILHSIEEMVIRGDTRPRSTPSSAAAATAPEVKTKTGWSNSKGASGGNDSFVGIKNALIGAFKFDRKAKSSESSSDDEDVHNPTVSDSPFPKTAPPARSFKDLPPPPLPRHMPFIVTLSTSEVKFGSRLGIRKKKDVGIHVGKEGGGGRVERGKKRQELIQHPATSI